MNTSDVADLTKRLDLIANLLTMLVAQSDNPPPITKRIMLLHEAGMGPADIGRIVGKSTGYVGAVTSQKKKAAKSKGR